MENHQKDQQSNQQQSAGEQNPTLNEPGTSVADYGNVMGGSSDQTAQEGGGSRQQEGESERMGNNDTIGNP